MKANTIEKLMQELIACRQRQYDAARRKDFIGFKQEHRHEMHIINKINELVRKVK